MKTTTDLRECPWCGDEGELLATELDTSPVSYAVLCANCGAQGPGAMSFEQANDEWDDRADLPFRGVPLRAMAGPGVPTEVMVTDDELEDAVTQRPDLLNRIVATGMLAASVRELAAGGQTLHDIVALVAGSPVDDDDDAGHG